MSICQKHRNKLIIRNVILLFILLLILNIPFLSLLSADEQKTTAAVMDLVAEEGISQSAGRMLSDYLRSQLVNTQKFTTGINSLGQLLEESELPNHLK